MTKSKTSTPHWLSQLVARACAKCGGQQQHLAERLECVPGWVSRVASGKSLPRVETLLAICAIAGLDHSEMLYVLLRREIEAESMKPRPCREAIAGYWHISNALVLLGVISNPFKEEGQ